MHGCERRDANGELHVAPVALEQLAEVRAGLQRLVARHPGLLLEDKGAGLALHFLQARELEHELRAEVALLAAPLVPQFALLDGHAVIEVKPAAHTKDSAVTRVHGRRRRFAAASRFSSATIRPTTAASPRCAASMASRSRSGRASSRNGGCPGPPPCGSG